MRKSVRISDGWRYSPQIQDLTFGDAYHLTKTGAARGMAAVSYDDNGWERVSVPHDAAVKGELNLELCDYNGFLHRPNTCYRRYFRLEESAKAGRVQLYFEGITGRSDIYINGMLAARSESSYNGIWVDMTDYVRFNGDCNVIAVLSDNSLPEGWWYEGAGIYRDVWLIESGRVSIEDDSVHITAVKQENEIWELSVEAEVYNAKGRDTSVTVQAQLMDEGLIAAADQTTVVLEERERRKLVFRLQIQNPRKWDIGQGNLYKVALRVLSDQEILDEYETEYGFRTIRFDSDTGFWINDRHEKIKGMCFHEDEGNLGAAVDKGVLRRRLENLLAMGANAYRCAHNTPNKQLLALCDRLGILVMEETRKFSSASIAAYELNCMVKRDRNHPCIILWSLGNEEPWQEDERGENMVRTMRRYVRELDGTRPVTMAMNSGHLNVHSAAAGCDVVGLNYNIEDYDALKALYPDKPMLATEVFSLADENEENGLYGADEAVKTLCYVKERPFIAGSFGWAGQDYRGEHRYLSFFTDACPIASNGERKDGFYRYLAAWGTEPSVHICGHWNYEEGQQVKVAVFGNTDAIELFLNGDSLGKASPGNSYQVVFWTKYEPGELRAVGYIGDIPVAETMILTSAVPTGIHLTALPAERGEYLVVQAESVDERGNRYPMGSHLVSFEVKNAEILCADNADPYFHRGDDDSSTMLYHGCARVVIKPPREGGEVEISVSSPTLKGDRLTVPVFAEEIQELPVEENPFINDWFVSQVWDRKPDIYEYTPDNQYIYGQKYFEAWRHSARQNPFYFRNGYMVYCTEPNLPDFAMDKTVSVVFERIAAGAEILISIRNYNNRILKQYYQKTKQCGEVRIPLDGAKGGDRLIIKVLMDSSIQRDGLIAMPVRFEVKG